MRETPLILIVDDLADNRQILRMRLQSQGYDTAEACDGEEALQAASDLSPDLILLDVMMPKLDGFEVCRRLRVDPEQPFVPIVLVTARAEVDDMVAGLEAGANDYLTKPVEKAALIARVRSMLRIKLLHDQVQGQRAELARWNTALEDRVAAQIQTIERTNRLRRFLPAPVADQILSAGDDEVLLRHQRAEIAVMFADLRGFTAYSERVEPEAVMAALNAFHRFAGPLVAKQNGTLERFLGDGMVVLFNAPLPCPDPVDRAVELGRLLQAGIGAVLGDYQTADCRLGLGIGIAYGPAALGQIGFEGRLDYAAIGTVSNLAARLCDRASDGQILIAGEAAKIAASGHQIAEIGPCDMKGIVQPVMVSAVGFAD